MDDIYGRMTNPHDPALKMERRAPDAVASAGVAMVLPEVSTNLLAGLMETLAGEPFNGKADLPEIADELSLEVDELFPIVETLQLLRFAEVAHGDIRLTPTGRRFVDLDVDARKRLFAEQLDRPRAHRRPDPPGAGGDGRPIARPTPAFPRNWRTSCPRSSPPRP